MSLKDKKETGLILLLKEVPKILLELAEIGNEKISEIDGENSQLIPWAEKYFATLAQINNKFAQIHQYYKSAYDQLKNEFESGKYPDGGIIKKKANQLFSHWGIVPGSLKIVSLAIGQNQSKVDAYAKLAHALMQRGNISILNAILDMIRAISDFNSLNEQITSDFQKIGGVNKNYNLGSSTQPEHSTTAVPETEVYSTAAIGTDSTNLELDPPPIADLKKISSTTVSHQAITLQLRKNFIRYFLQDSEIVSHPVVVEQLEKSALGIKLLKMVKHPETTGLSKLGMAPIVLSKRLSKSSAMQEPLDALINDPALFQAIVVLKLPELEAQYEIYEELYDEVAEILHNGAWGAEKAKKIEKILDKFLGTVVKKSGIIIEMAAIMGHKDVSMEEEMEEALQFSNKVLALAKKFQSILKDCQMRPITTGKEKSRDCQAFDSSDLKGCKTSFWQSWHSTQASRLLKSPATSPVIRDDKDVARLGS